MSRVDVGEISNQCRKILKQCWSYAYVGQMMHVTDVNHYYLRDDTFNIRGRLAQLRRAWLNEVLYNLFLFTAIISNFSDYNFVGTFSQELLTKKIIVSALDSRPGRGLYAVFLGTTLNTHSACLHPGV